MKTLKEMTEPELHRLFLAIWEIITLINGHLDIEKLSFCIVVFNDPEFVHYASNCKRSDMIKALEEAMAKLKRNEDVLQ
jgi:hypothetical protein